MRGVPSSDQSCLSKISPAKIYVRHISMQVCYWTLTSHTTELSSSTIAFTENLCKDCRRKVKAALDEPQSTLESCQTEGYMITYIVVTCCTSVPKHEVVDSIAIIGD